jgi:NADH-quinone oxidoreductase E subunit
MARLSEQNLAKAHATVALYPEARSALIPLCHLSQSQDGYLTPEGIEHVAEIVGVTPAEVRGTASFYDMFHLEPVGQYVVALCTNIACMLSGAFDLLEHAEEHLGIGVGQTTSDGMFTLEEAECLAGCDVAPCVQVNHRFFGPIQATEFDELVANLASGSLDDAVPHHGVLNRVERSVGLVAGGDGLPR